MINVYEQQYLDMLRDIRHNGVEKTDRTGTGTRSTFGTMMRFDISGGKLPVLTTKKIFLKGIIHELLWFLKGETNIKYLTDNNVHIWDEWAVTEKSLHDRYLKAAVDALAVKGQRIEDDAYLLHITDLSFSRISVPVADVPQGWTITERYNQPEGPRCSAVSPDFYTIALDHLIRMGFAPADCRQELGNLGPVYGKQWRDWRMVVEEEDLSMEALLKRHLDWKIQTGAVAADHFDYGFVNVFVPSTGGDFVVGQLHRKRYDCEFPYVFVANGFTKPEWEHNTELFYAQLLHDVKKGEATAPIMKSVTKGFDQIGWLINRLKTQPDCRRMIVSAWNVGELAKMALSPCHALFQFYSAPLSDSERMDLLKAKLDTGAFENTGSTETWEQHFNDQNIPKFKLSCLLYQRSVDTLLGLPFNIVSYALLTQMIAQATDMVAGEFVWVGGDTHVYKNHFEQVDLQLSRTPLDIQPIMKINPAVKDIFGFTIDDFELVGYESHPAIKAPIAV
jgi:thymidylate synthase